MSKISSVWSIVGVLDRYNYTFRIGILEEKKQGERQQEKDWDREKIAERYSGLLLFVNKVSVFYRGIVTTITIPAYQI